VCRSGPWPVRAAPGLWEWPLAAIPAIPSRAGRAPTAMATLQSFPVGAASGLWEQPLACGSSLWPVGAAPGRDPCNPIARRARSHSNGHLAVFSCGSSLFLWEQPLACGSGLWPRSLQSHRAQGALPQQWPPCSLFLWEQPLACGSGPWPRSLQPHRAQGALPQGGCPSPGQERPLAATKPHE